ncbi:MAG: creatininase family protein [Bacteroides sp.]|nr:creatininase family protein [Bacteroides sp.]MBD5363433.1 creatininase family protein [Bacteroides sp.]
MELSKVAYGDVKDLHFDIAILPWGATEPHNLHLPYLTDAILAHEVSADAAKLAEERYGVRAMVLPALPLGAQNPGQRELPFCIHYSHQTQFAVLRDIVHSLNHQGIKRLLIVNGHGGNTFKPFIRDLAVELPDFLIAVSEWFAVLPAKEYFDNPGDHADELETSVMMHYHPELVDLSRAGEGKANPWPAESLRKKVAWVPRNWLKTTADTGIGDPSASTAEKGASYAADCAAAYALLLKELVDLDV